MDRASATDLVERGVDVASTVAGRGVDVATTVASSVLETAIDTASEVIDTATDAVQRVIDRRTGSRRRISAGTVLAILAALGVVGAVVIQRRKNRAAIADHAAAASTSERPNAFAAA